MPLTFIVCVIDDVGRNCCVYFDEGCWGGGLELAFAFAELCSDVVVVVDVVIVCCCFFVVNDCFW